MPSRRPNILLIVCDQMTPLLTGAYGHPVVQTPNLDRLVERGVRFDAAYSPVPICAPARACMMTGRYGSRISIYDNATALHCDEPCFTHCLALAGYDNVLCGKMHFVGPDQLHGYRARLVRNIYPADFVWTPERDYEGKPFARQCLSPGDWIHATAYLEADHEVGKWHPSLAYDEEVQFRAKQYLSHWSEKKKEADAHGEDYQPFQLTVSYHHPHEPYHAPRECWEMYAGVDIPIPQFPENWVERYSQMDEWMAEFHGCDRVRERLLDPENLRALHRAYYAMITYTDQMVGELLDLLEQRGLAEDTIILFTSDHGDMLGDHGHVQKRMLYENSARVPLIISVPDGTGAGRQVGAPVNLVDLLPTLCGMGGYPLEETTPHDGRSLLPYVRGEADEDEAITFAEQHTDGIYTTCFMARRGRFKYVHIHGYEPQLFDLETDPEEWNNLAGEADYAEVEQELREAVLENFDPEAVEQDVRRTIRNRRVIQRAMMENDTTWAVSPAFSRRRNSASQYDPGGVE